jgi:hypothetical protein
MENLKRLKDRLEKYFKLKNSKTVQEFCADAGIKYTCTVARLLSGKRKGVSVENYLKIESELNRLGVQAPKRPVTQTAGQPVFN